MTPYVKDLIMDVFVAWEVQSKIAQARLEEARTLDSLLSISNSITEAERRKYAAQSDMVMKMDEAIDERDRALAKEMRRAKRASTFSYVLGAAIPAFFLGGMGVGIYIAK